jgi:putative transposase
MQSYEVFRVDSSEPRKETLSFRGGRNCEIAKAIRFSCFPAVIIQVLKLTAKIRLNSTPEQGRAMLDTLEQANACANWISGEAWQRKVFGHYSLHKILYAEARQRFPLSAQIAVRVLAKVADAYKLDKKSQRSFRKHGAICYDSRILRYKVDNVSIWTTGGRLTIGYSAGDGQKELLKSQQGESDLIYHRGKFYLAASCNAVDPEPMVVDAFLGIDMGIKSIAADSDGSTHSGSEVNNVRYRHRALRTKLQSRGSRSAKRKLRDLSGKEARFAADVNHCLSKQIVTLAKGTHRGVAVEELGGIRERVTVRRKQRVQLHSWSFFQLRSFLAYKARLSGVPLVAVDPRNTSRQCSACGHIDKASRKTQAKFVCVSCGHAAHADTNAARNIRDRATCQVANRSELC